MENKFTLLGEKLSHSLSPEIHSLLGNYGYDLSPIEKSKLASFFEKSEYKGFNVTIPYKIEAFNRCDILTATAREIGSVNTCLRKDDGTLYGDNTDAYGFAYMLKKAGCEPKGKKAVVLGSGGSSKAVSYVLKKQGAEVVIISRSGENNYGNLEKHFDADIVVNTTPVGMFPNPGVSPVEISNFQRCGFVFDLIYNPFRTKLIQDTEKLGIKAVSGLSMLTAQAKRSSEIFNGTEIPDNVIDKICSEIKLKSANIVLTGMPGCGKTTVGREIAEKLDRPFIDTDEEIIKCGKTITEIIEKDGETAFRNIESRVIAGLRNSRGTVIATGGGAIIRDENVEALRENGIVVFLDTPLEMLETKGRPLSNKNGIENIYRERIEKYRKSADIIFKVNYNSKTDEVIKCIYSL